MASLTAALLDRSRPGAPLARVARRPPAVEVVDVPVARAEELEAAGRAWETRFEQMDAGCCRGRHLGIRTPRARLDLESWSLGMVKIGRAPAGCVGFLVPMAGEARVQGKPLAVGEVVLLFGGEPFQYRSSGAAELLSVAMERGAVEAHARALFGRCLAELRLQGRLAGLRADPERLRRVCLDLVGRAQGPGRRGAIPEAERAIVKALLGAGAAGDACSGRGRGRVLALQAEAWLRQNLAEAPTIAVLCAALGASERTVHEAFREYLDVTPKAYLKTMRLNAARHALLSGRAGLRVTDIALDWGFLHFGWFSQDYRRHFGETPSQTLQRGRAGRPSPVAGRREAVPARGAG